MLRIFLGTSQSWKTRENIKEHWRILGRTEI
jgi:hypothetical protein